MNTIRAQPMPISSRLAPVMLARTSEQLEAPWSSGALQLAPYWATSLPPFQANTNPTAYSGRTAIRARTPMARLAEVEQLGQAEVGPGDAGGHGQDHGDRSAPGGGGRRLRVSCQRVLRLGRVPWGTPDGSKVSSAREAGEAPGGRWRPPS